MELQALPLSVLYDLRLQITAEVTRRELAEKRAATQRVQKLMRLQGLEKTALNKPVAEKRPLVAKYHNPVDPSLTWTGRGRKPEWVQMYLDNGGTLEQLTR